MGFVLDNKGNIIPTIIHAIDTLREYGVSGSILEKIETELKCEHTQIVRAEYTKDSSIPELIRLPYCMDCGKEFALGDVEIIPEQIRLIQKH